jgi:hypothetical protein
MIILDIFCFQIVNHSKLATRLLAQIANPQFVGPMASHTPASASWNASLADTLPKCWSSSATDRASQVFNCLSQYWVDGPKE